MNLKEITALSPINVKRARSAHTYPSSVEENLPQSSRLRLARERRSNEIWVNRATKIPIPLCDETHGGMISNYSPVGHRASPSVQWWHVHCSLCHPISSSISTFFRPWPCLNRIDSRACCFGVPRGIVAILRLSA